MNTDVLRRAASGLRDEWSGGNEPTGTAWHRERDLHLAVADWLDLMAEDYAPYWSEPYAAPFVPVIEKSYRVAHAYLGESA